MAQYRSSQPGYLYCVQDYCVLYTRNQLIFAHNKILPSPPSLQPEENALSAKDIIKRKAYIYSVKY